MKVNIKLAIALVLLFVLVPAALIIPLHEQVAAVEASQQKELLRAAKTKTSEKSCKKVALKTAVTVKKTCKTS